MCSRNDKLSVTGKFRKIEWIIGVLNFGLLIISNCFNLKHVLNNLFTS